MRTLIAAALVLPALVLAGAPAAQARTLTMGKGQTLQVRLNEPTDVGYRWSVTKKPSRKVLRAVSNKRRSTRVKNPAGKTVTQVQREFRWRAVASGTTTITLGYLRSGKSGGVKPVRYTIKVR